MVGTPRSALMKQQAEKSGRQSGGKRKVKSYDKSFKLRVVKLVEEDGIPPTMVCAETGVARTTLHEWQRLWRTGGEEALARKLPGGPGKRLPTAVDEKIVELKRENPSFGVRRIADTLFRVFALPGGKEKVRTTLNDVGLIVPPKEPRKRNVAKPRFFERSTPNQLWQSDIFMWRPGGEIQRNFYLIGFIDDYSRFMVSLGVFAGQTAENVLETYRRGVADHGAPKEMLTDNGRQYANWRGKTRFQSEMSKDKVQHIRSSPHHPQTCGKIERFWKTIHEEFLQRARFSSLEDARERIALWVKYYNSRRPHQGIGGMCPADRFYEVATELRKSLEAQVEENVLELALRGRAKDPFFLVGQVEGQSVVVSRRDGKLELTVADRPAELGKNTIHEMGGGDGPGDCAGNGSGVEVTQTTAEPLHRVHPGPEVRGGIASVDGTSQRGGSVSRDGYRVDYIEPVARASDGGDAAGSGAPGAVGRWLEPESTLAGAAASQTRGAIGPFSESIGEHVGPGSQGLQGDERGRDAQARGVVDGTHREGASSHGVDHQSVGWGATSDTGSGGLGDIASGLLRLGTSLSGGIAGSHGGSALGSPHHGSAGGCRDGSTAQGECGVSQANGDAGQDSGPQRTVGRVPGDHGGRLLGFVGSW